MEKIYLDEAALISIQPNLSSEDGCEIKYLTGKVINDESNKFQIGRFIITLQLELCGRDVFLTKDGLLFETSNSPSTTEVFCSEFLLMRINSFKLSQVLAMRQCNNNAKLISAFDH